MYPRELTYILHPIHWLSGQCSVPFDGVEHTPPFAQADQCLLSGTARLALKVNTYGGSKLMDQLWATRESAMPGSASISTWLILTQRENG